MINYEQAGQRIRLQRQRLGRTQDDVSEKIGITPSYYSQIESGKRKASIKTFVGLSQELSISLDHIFGNKINSISFGDLDNIEYQIIYSIRKFSPENKEFVLNMINLLIQKDIGKEK